MHSREQYLEEVRKEYVRADKQERSQLLNEARRRTRLNRKYLIRILNGRKTAAAKHPARRTRSMDWLGTWGVAMGAAWLSGVKLYASVLTLGLLQRFGFAHLPGDLHILGDWWVIAMSGLLFLVEFVADKIPAFDSAWDAIHTFIRVPAGAVLAAAAFGHFDSRVRLLAFLLGGGIALTSHGTKATARLAVNTSPEPFSNVALSVMEDVGSVGLSLVAAFHPIVALVIVVVLIVFGILIVRKFARGIRGLFRTREAA